MEQPDTIEVASGDNILFVGGAVAISREEVQAAVDLKELINSKVDHVRRMFLTGIIEGINAKGWALVEYAENTTGL